MAVRILRIVVKAALVFVVVTVVFAVLRNLPFGSWLAP